MTRGRLMAVCLFGATFGLCGALAGVALLGSKGYAAAVSYSDHADD